MKHRQCKRIILCFLIILLQGQSMVFAFDLQAHRGGRDLRPENTMSAFIHAIDLGVTTLELDVAMTKDAVIVISHNPYLSNTLVQNAAGEYVSENPRQYIKDMTFDELSSYTVGVLNSTTSYYRKHKTQLPQENEHIPSLEMLFSYVDQLGLESLHFNIEIKTYPQHPQYTVDKKFFASAVLALIQKYDKEAVCTIQSFDWSVLSLIKATESPVAVSCLTSRYLRIEGKTFNLRPHEAGPSPWLDGFDIDDYDSISELVYDFGADIISPYYKDITRTDVKEAHALGLQIIPWTIDNPVVMKRMISWGVDGIITDRPDLLLEMVN